MLKDMLEPPINNDDDEGQDAVADDRKAVAERAGASIDETIEAVGASEERNAAMESESMKNPKR